MHLNPPELENCKMKCAAGMNQEMSKNDEV